MGKKKKAKKLAERAKGKLKETASAESGDSQLEAEGNVDDMKGHVKLAGENVKDALKE